MSLEEGRAERAAAEFCKPPLPEIVGGALDDHPFYLVKRAIQRGYEMCLEEERVEREAIKVIAGNGTTVSAHRLAELLRDPAHAIKLAVQRGHALGIEDEKRKNTERATGASPTPAPPNNSLDPFDHLAGKTIARAKYMYTEPDRALRVACIDFTDGASLTFSFDREVRIFNPGASGVLTLAYTPTGKR